MFFGFWKWKKFRFLKINKFQRGPRKIDSFIFVYISQQSQSTVENRNQSSKIFEKLILISFLFRYLGYAAKILTCYTSGTWNSLMTTGLNFCPETDTETGLYVSASSVRLMPVATNVRSQPHLSSVRLLHWMLWVSSQRLTISNSVFSILK